MSRPAARPSRWSTSTNPGFTSPILPGRPSIVIFVRRSIADAHRAAVELADDHRRRAHRLHDALDTERPAPDCDPVVVAVLFTGPFPLAPRAQGAANASETAARIAAIAAFEPTVTRAMITDGDYRTILRM